MERRQFLQSTGLGAAATMLGVAPLTAATTHLSFLKENVMSEQPRPYEPLTSENAALILIDHQVGLMTGVRDYSTGELKHNVVGLAKAAKALKLPISQRPRGTACGARPFRNSSRRCLAFQSSIARL